MKVLWFANTPCGATEFLTGRPVLGGGWLHALSEQLIKVPGLQLHIAFYWGKALSPFQYRGICYYPVLKEGEGSKFGRLINRYFSILSRNQDNQCVSRLLNVIDEVRPELIHIHGSESNFGLIATRQLPCPLVLSIQGLLNPIYMKYYGGFTKREILRHEGMVTKIALTGVSAKERSIKKKKETEQFFLRFVPNIIGRTFWDKAGSMALNPKRRYFEVGEIMRRDFYNNCWNKDAFSTPFIITTTISNGYYKGLETIYHTARVLKEAGFSFEWNVIGISKDDTLARLSEKQVGDNAVNLNIRLLGRKSAQEMVGLMKAADLFVQVSHIENSPNSLGEAMLMGMPIIATFAGGTASMLENNVEGRLLQDGEPYSMAGMIMELAADYKNAKRMGEKARATALRRHNPEHVCNQLLNAYKEILGSRDA